RSLVMVPPAVTEGRVAGLWVLGGLVACRYFVITDVALDHEFLQVFHRLIGKAVVVLGFLPYAGEACSLGLFTLSVLAIFALFLVGRQTLFNPLLDVVVGDLHLRVFLFD